MAYALAAGTTDIDLVNDPMGTGEDGAPIYLRYLAYQWRPGRWPRLCRRKCSSTQYAPTSGTPRPVERPRKRRRNLRLERRIRIPGTPFFTELTPEVKPISNIQAAHPGESRAIR
ncbi:MAG: hypothetical protein IPM76_18455 [Chloroflexi bacterium]|nr:hypothetical protein [Chloroflexota bacterium]